MKRKTVAKRERVIDDEIYMMNLEEFFDMVKVWVTKYGNNATISVSADDVGTFYEEYRVQAHIEFERPETDEEFEKRKKTAAKRRAATRKRNEQKKLEAERIAQLKKDEEYEEFVRLQEKFKEINE